MNGRFRKRVSSGTRLVGARGSDRQGRCIPIIRKYCGACGRVHIMRSGLAPERWALPHRATSGPIGMWQSFGRCTCKERHAPRSPPHFHVSAKAKSAAKPVISASFEHGELLIRWAFPQSTPSASKRQFSGGRGASSIRLRRRGAISSRRRDEWIGITLPMRSRNLAARSRLRGCPTTLHRAVIDDGREVSSSHCADYRLPFCSPASDCTRKSRSDFIARRRYADQ